MGDNMVSRYWLFLRNGLTWPEHLAVIELVSNSIAGGIGILARRASALVANRLLVATGEDTSAELPVIGYKFPQQPAQQNKALRG